MPLNRNKCANMRFAKKSSKQINTRENQSRYSINDTGIVMVKEILDLGIYFSPNLDFKTHYTYIFKGLKRWLA